MTESYYLPARKLKLRRREDGTLFMHLDGQSIDLGSPKRSLPLSEPNRFIVLYDMDGNELGILRDVEELEPESSSVLQEVLSEIYVIQRITRILEVERDTLTGQTRWRVEIAADSSKEPGTEPPLVAQNTAPQTTQPLTDGNNTSTNGADKSSTTKRPDADGSYTDGTLPTPASKLIAALHHPFDTHNGKENGKENEEKVNHDSSHNGTNTDEKLMDKILLFRHRTSTDKEHDDESMTVEEREFLINGQEDVQTARYPHIFIVDTERNRYEIVDCEALDLESRRAAERFF